MDLTRPRLAFAGVLALVALTGCSGGGGGGQHTADGGTAAADSVAAPSAREAAGALGNTGNAAGVHRAGAGSAQNVQQAAIIKNGEVEIRTPDPQHARDGVDGLLEQLRGSLDAEQTVYDKKGRIHDSHLVLRVPVATFTEAMRKVEGLGTVVHSSSTAQDVTTQVIDVQQRLKTLRISLHDLNSFQRQASTSARSCASRTRSPSGGGSTSRSRPSATTCSTRPACPRSTSTSPCPPSFAP
jgi:hypothetical protein